MNQLQIQQARLNQIVMSDNFGPTALVLEGRDTACKSSTIREVTHYLPVDKFSVQLSSKPSKATMNDWLGYWSTKMPFGEQIVFYDRLRTFNNGNLFTVDNVLKFGIQNSSSVLIQPFIRCGVISFL